MILTMVVKLALSFLREGEEGVGTVPSHTAPTGPFTCSQPGLGLGGAGGTAWPGEKHFLNHLATPLPYLTCHGAEKGEDLENMIKIGSRLL